MCGIVGYTGESKAVEIVFSGLKKLEYRGYDSAGIVVSHENDFHLIKSKGKLTALNSLREQLPPTAHVGMGHTRWATHGPPNQKNSHPHQAPGVTIIHNGIIENYKELKLELTASGVTFQSDTDTEVIAHLLAQALCDHSIEESITQTLQKLRGAFALGMMFTANPEEIYLAKNGSPLVIGLGENENFFGSDAIPFCEEVKRVIYLKDGQWGKISKSSVSLWDRNGEPVSAKGDLLNWNFGSIEKQGYRHFMLKEIHQQPDVIARTISNLTKHESHELCFEALGLENIDLNVVTKIHIVACGTAYIAGLLGKYFLEPATEISVNVEMASEFRYRQPHLGNPQTNLVIAVSQSGETADTLASVSHAKELGCQILSICNVNHSSIPRSSDGTLYMDAGPEIGVASTKAFTSQVLCLYLMTLGIGQRRGKIGNEQIQKEIDLLQKLPFYLQSALDQESKILQLAKKFYEFPNFLFVGRGTSFPIALEGALKLKEISYIHAEGYAAGELKHGPIALVDHHMPIVAIVPQDQYFQKALSNLEEIHAREGLIISIGDESNSHLLEISDEVIHCPFLENAAFQAILSTIPIQLLAYHIAVKRGTDVDQPRNLAKSVTVE